MNKTLAKKIKQARIEMGLTQTDLAVRVGISAQSISAFESGRIPPAREYIEKIAQFTHKPLYFFTGEKVAQALAKVELMIDELQSLKEILSQVVETEET